MFNPPLTIEDAKKYRYNKWAGIPPGEIYDEKYCAAEVPDVTGWHFYQCSRKNGKGPNGLYCGIHAKEVTDDTK